MPRGAAVRRNPSAGAHHPPKLSKAELMGTGSRRGFLMVCSQTRFSCKHSQLASVVVSITCNHLSCQISPTFMPWMLLCYSFPP